MSCSALPDELLEQIIEHLDEDEDLIACSKTSKALLPLARARLFSILRLFREGDFFLQNRHLLQYVKEIVISGADFSRRVEPDATWLTELDDAFFHDILRRPLEFLHLECIHWKTIPAGVRKFLLQVDALKLEVAERCFRTEHKKARFLSTFPSAKSLYLIGGILPSAQTKIGDGEDIVGTHSIIRPRRVAADFPGFGETHVLTHPSIDLSGVHFFEMLSGSPQDPTRSLEDVFVAICPSVRELVLHSTIADVTELHADAALGKGVLSLQRAVNLEKLELAMALCYPLLDEHSCSWVSGFLSSLQRRGSSAPLREVRLNVKTYSTADEVADGSFTEFDAAMSMAPWRIIDSILSDLSSVKLLEVKLDIFVEIVGVWTSTHCKKEDYPELFSRIHNDVSQRYLPLVTGLGILCISVS